MSIKATVAEIASSGTHDQALDRTIVIFPEILPSKTNASTLPQNWSPIVSKFTSDPVIILQVFLENTKQQLVPWDEILDCAYSIKHELHDHVTQRCPVSIYLIGYGLGGLLLKSVFNLACSQPSRYKDLVERCSGIALLATPHIAGTSSDWQNRFVSAFKSGTKVNEKRLVTAEQFSKLHLVCLNFKDNLDKLPLSTLSGFTNKAPKTSKWIFGSVHSPSVDESFARIGLVGKEIVQEIDCDIDKFLYTNKHSRFTNTLFKHCDKCATLVREHFEEMEQKRDLGLFLDALRIDVQQNMDPSVGRQTPQETTHLGVSPRPTLQTSSGSLHTDAGFTVVADANTIPQATKSVQLPCYYPSERFRPTPKFTGRKTELDMMEEILVTAPADAEHPRVDLRTFVLYGIGGSGKTELALEFLHLHFRSFDAVFCLKADSINRLETGYCDLAVRLGLESEEMKKQPETCKSSVIAWLENPVRWIDKTAAGTFPSADRSTDTSTVKWLMVLDNADHPELLSNFWPKAGKGSILVTSRDPMTVSQFFFPTAHAELVGLPEDEAVQLLLRLINKAPAKCQKEDEMEAQAKVLVKKLEYLPLAIDQIGAILCRQGLSITAFLDVYKREKDFNDLKTQHPGRGTYEWTLATVWALGQLDDDSRALLNVMAMLDPEFVQDEVLQACFKTKIQVPNFPKTQAEYYTARGGLLETSMVSLVQKHSLRRVSDAAKVHRLVQAATRYTMLNEGLLTTSFSQALSSVDSLWPWQGRTGYYVLGTSEKIDRWEACKQLFPHIEQLGRIYEEYLTEAEDRSFEVMFVDMLAEAAWYQCERENPRVASPLLRIILPVAETEGFGDAHPAELSSVYSALVWSSVYMKDVSRAFHFAQKRCSLHESLLAKGEKPTSDTAVSCNDLGMTYAFNGVYDKAIKYLERSMEIRKNFPGFQKMMLFTPSLQLGKVYWKIGKYDDAATILLDALQAREDALGHNDRDSIRTGSLLYFLGNVRASQGRHDEAYAYHLRALNHQRITVGDKAPITLRAWYRVGEHELRYGRSDDARDVFDKILKAYGDEPYRKHERARGCFFHALALRNLGDVAKAEERMVEAAQLFNEISPNDIRTSQTLSAEDVDRLNFHDML